MKFGAGDGLGMGSEWLSCCDMTHHSNGFQLYDNMVVTRSLSELINFACAFTCNMGMTLLFAILNKKCFLQKLQHIRLPSSCAYSQ